jgi:hypothetical protein
MVGAPSSVRTRLNADPDLGETVDGLEEAFG